MLRNILFLIITVYGSVLDSLNAAKAGLLVVINDVKDNGKYTEAVIRKRCEDKFVRYTGVAKEEIIGQKKFEKLVVEIKALMATCVKQAKITGIN